MSVKPGSVVCGFRIDDSESTIFIDIFKVKEDGEIELGSHVYKNGEFLEVDNRPESMNYLVIMLNEIIDNLFSEGKTYSVNVGMLASK